jgi:hypothetical protein
VALLREACPGTRICLALPTPGNCLSGWAANRPPRGLFCVACAMDWKWRGAGGMAQVRFHPGGPEASVDDEGVPEEQPDRLDLLPASPGSQHPHVRPAENADLGEGVCHHRTIRAIPQPHGLRVHAAENSALVPLGSPGPPHGEHDQPGRPSGASASPIWSSTAVAGQGSASSDLVQVGLASWRCRDHADPTCLS